jgi:hypothetical protein
MPDAANLPRLVRRRRERKARAGRISRPAGRFLLCAALIGLAAGIGLLLSPAPLAPVLQIGQRPGGAQFFDRNGKLLAEAGSVRAADARWYSPAAAPPGDCVLSAYLAAHGIGPEGLPSPTLFDGIGGALSAAAGARSPAAEAAAEAAKMNGMNGGLWTRVRLAGALAARHPQAELVEWLINVRLYGRGTVGVDDAALVYFGTHTAGLSIAQCAALEALAEDPRRAEDPAALQRGRNSLLTAMRNGGFLETGGWERAVAEPPAFSPAPADPLFGGRVPVLDSFLRLAVGRLAGRIPEQELPRADLRVFTTLDLDFELQAVCAAQNLLAPAASNRGTTPTLDGRPCDLAALLGPAAETDSPEDLALAVIDPVGGDLLAYFDSARAGSSAAAAPAGKALLPFVYLSAFTRGFSPASLLYDIPLAGWPEAESGSYRGPVSARTALQRGSATAAAGMTERVGADHLARTFALLGLSGGQEDFDLAAEMDRPAELLELNRAYALLAGSGLDVSAADSGASPVILRVEGRDGAVFGDYDRRRTRRVFGSDLAYLLQEVLSDPEGRADLSAPALAGSRSTVASFQADDADGAGGWAFAFAPGFSIGVRSRGYPAEGGSSRPAWTLVQAAAGWALRGLPVQSWIEPPGIVRAEVCVPSGLLPSRYCPAVASELFLAGYEPSQVDSYYRPVAVNRETGRLATLWTPLNLVEEKTFFTVEEDARAWAEMSGFPLPPDTYDTLPDSFPFFSDLHISSPTPLAAGRGIVELRGTAAAAGMLRWVVQAGAGLYPAEWYTLGSGESAVREGVLGRWDTAGTDGIWSIQLTAVFAGQKVLTVAIPVVLDNTPPLIRWIEPATPARMSLSRGAPLILQVEVAENLGLAGVEFFLDGKVRTRLESGPFSIRWTNLAPGSHIVHVCAADRIGNETCTQEIAVEVG